MIVDLKNYKFKFKNLINNFIFICRFEIKIRPKNCKGSINFNYDGTSKIEDSQRCLQPPGKKELSLPLNKTEIVYKNKKPDRDMYMYVKDLIRTENARDRISAVHD